MTILAACNRATLPTVHKSIHTLFLAIALCVGALNSGIVLSGAAFAQESTSPAQSAPASVIKTQTAQIKALIAGRLDLKVDAAGLFTSSLIESDAPILRWVLALTGDTRLYQAARKNVALLTGLTPDEADLALAQAEFLRLPAARRTGLLEAHQHQQEAVKTTAIKTSQRRQELHALQVQAAGLQAFLDGQPTSISNLKINLLDPSGVALDRGRRLVLLKNPNLSEKPLAKAGAPTPPPNSDDTEPANIEKQIKATEAAVDGLRAEILALSPPAREKLAAIQAVATAKHQQATLMLAAENQQQLKTEAQAANAQSETDLLVAAQEQKLLGTQKALAAVAQDLTEQETAIAQIGDLALGWHRKATNTANSSDGTTEADRLYRELIDALRLIRSNLNKALSESSDGGIATPSVPSLDKLLPPNDNRTLTLERLRSQLATNATKLDGRAKVIGWKRRTALYNAMIDMNGARLLLIDSLSRPMRAKVTGFDEEGLAQVQREAYQIYLTIRYNLAFGSTRIAVLTDLILHPRSGQIFALIELIALAFAFRIWRQRGGQVLLGIERAYELRRPATLLSSTFAYIAKLLRKVRRPLDWLILLLFLDWVLPSLTSFGLIRIIWLILVWVLTGAVLIYFIDALAQGSRRDDPRAELRRRSLRLVVGIVLGFGLILSLATAAVGQGAIYSWTLSFCWLLVIPVVIVLVSWWRERIDSLVALGAPKSAVLAWSAAHPEGLAGVIGRTIAGAVLMFQGAQSVIANRINHLSLIREISGQRAREKAAARVMADEASGRYTAISPEQSAQLSRHVPRPATVKGYVRNAAPFFPELIPGRIFAVIGERGLGKTTALSDMLETNPAAQKITISTGTKGFADILASLAKELHCSATQKAIRAKLSKGEYSIAIDDIQRLVVPAIGGLEEFDKLIAFARAAGPQAAWVFSIGGPAWSYLSRARSDRAIFDSISYLPRWQVSEIRAFIEARTRQAGLKPEFGVEVYNAGQMLFDSDIAPEERTRRLFFKEITEYSDGNPAVALEFWRHSLFDDHQTNGVAVRTYKTPDIQTIAMLPKPTLFVLRAILQMEIAAFDKVTQSTDLAAVIVGEALRALVQLGVIVETNGTYRLTLFWFQDVRRLLERQNLIVRITP